MKKIMHICNKHKTTMGLTLNDSQSFNRGEFLKNLLQPKGDS